MKQVISTILLLHAMAILISCAGSGTLGSHEFSTPAPTEVLTASVPVKAGTYVATAQCASGKALMSEVGLSVFTLKADGTYTEEVSVRGPGCDDKDCDLFLIGEYKITYSKATFHQKIKLNRSLKNDSAEQVKEFEFVGKDDAKGEITLRSNSADNVCGEKMKLVLSAKDTAQP